MPNDAAAEPKVGDIVTFASEDGAWSRKLKVTLVDGGSIRYEPCDG
jgi:hypothetical protein